jgi:putative ABC transport system permease protein
MGTLLQNFRFGLRVLAKNPSFTLAAVLCLALGIGATTAIFSVVDAVLLRPLPYAQSVRLVRVFTEFPTFPNGGLRHFWVSPPEYLDLKRDTNSWDELEAWVNQGVNLAGASEPVRAQASYVSGGMLSMLGIAPLLGRVFRAEDDRPNVPATAVLSYGLWQRGYGGDVSILGRDIHLNGESCTVIGVMPASFAFPPGETDPVDLWSPLQIDPAKPGGRGSHYLSVLGRLRNGVTIAQAQGEMDRYTVHSKQTIGPQNHPFDPKFHLLVLAGFQDEVVHSVRRAMLVLLGAVVFVLLIACVNVANLLLARSEARRREIAVRAAVGAGAGRLLGQFVAEGILLSLAGAALGVLLAFGGLRLLAATNAGSIPRAAEIGIDWQVLLFTLGVSFSTGVVFGLAPIVHMRPAALHDILKSAMGRATAGSAANRFRAALVIAELALALVLLIGSGLMVKAFWKLQQVDAGIDPRNLLTLRLALPVTAYREVGVRAAFFGSLVSRVQSTPGVVSAAVATGLPPIRRIDANDTMIEGFVPRPDGPIQNIDYYNSVSGHYFETAGAHLLEGRFLNDGDGASSTPVVVVNRTLARTFWPHESALGHRVRSGPPTAPWRTIVGVVGDIKNAGLDRATGTELYFPYPQNPAYTAYLLVRTKGDPMSFAGGVRNQVHELDRALPISGLRSMEDALSSDRARPRFLTLLLTLFSSLSLALAALGIYGVISYSVAQRTNEIGIRMALGAQSGDVLRLVTLAGLRLAVAGALIGSAGSLALTRTLSGLLFGVSSVDPLTFAGMATALIAVTMLACYFPARRASKVDPLVALRYE